MINPKRKLWKWGPIDGQVLYIDHFMEEMVYFQKTFGVSWCDVLTHIKDEKVLIVVDDKDLYDAGEEVLKKFIDKKTVRKSHYKKWMNLKDEMTTFSLSLKEIDLNNLSDEALAKTIRDFHKLYDMFWTYGFIPELANWGCERLLRRAVSKNHPDHFIDIFEIISSPEELSFYQIEKLELLRIKLIKDGSEKMKALKEHQKKYFWLMNSYGGTKVLPNSYFQKELENTTLSNANDKIKEIENFSPNVRAKKQALIKKYKIGPRIADLGSQIAFWIWWQDYRKKYIFIALHALTLLARELGRRNGIPFKDMLFYARKDLFALADKKKSAPVENLVERKKGYVSYYSRKDNKCVYYFGEQANKLLEPYVNHEFDENLEEIKGLVVSKGKAKGKVKVLIGSKNFDKFKKGDILVTSMTSPDFIVVMRKASAIITDEGGITSHAAIVSRELGIPCIVGTKIATKVFKDGDMIEVDTNKGIVKKI